MTDGVNRADSNGVHPIEVNPVLEPTEHGFHRAAHQSDSRKES